MAERVTLVEQGGANGAPPPDLDDTQAVPGSIVARLREAAKAQRQHKTHDIAVGGEFGDRLVIRYQPLPPAQMDRFIAARQGLKMQDISATAATMDMMAHGCVEVIGRYGGEEEVLADSDGPVRLEDRLARLLDLRSPSEPVLTAHEVITRLFGNNGAMIAMHGDKLATWMQDPATASAGDDVGES